MCQYLGMCKLTTRPGEQIKFKLHILNQKEKDYKLGSEIHPTFGNDTCIKKSHQFIKKISLI